MIDIDPDRPFTVTDRDFQRASALLSCYALNDGPGVYAAIDEAMTEERGHAVMWCIPALLAAIGLLGAQHADALSGYATAFAARDIGGQ